MTCRIALILLFCFSPLGFYSFPLYFFTCFFFLPCLFFLLFRLCSLGTSPSSDTNPFRGLVIAHRGGQPKADSGEPVFPENSLAAFRWASSQRCGGADAFELDVYISKDGVPMVSHDPSLYRHFAGDGLICDKTVAELKKISYRSKPHMPSKLTTEQNAYEKVELEEGRTLIDPKYVESERMPTLEEVLILLERECPHMKCMIEVKERTHIPAICAAIKALYDKYEWMYSRCFVASFNPIALYRIRLLDERIVTSFLFVRDATAHLIKNARDANIYIPEWFIHNYPLRWLMDDLLWSLGSNPWGLRFLGANMSGCEVNCLTSNQIKKEKFHHIVTTAWVANDEIQKEWLLRQGVTVITDIQFGPSPFNKHHDGNSPRAHNGEMNHKP